MLPSEADIAVAVFGAIKHYGWKHIAIITQNENILTLVSFVYLYIHVCGIYIFCISYFQFLSESQWTLCREGTDMP